MLTEIKNAHTYICWPIKINLCLAPVDGYQVFTRLLKDGSDVSFLYFLGSVMGWTIETRCLFRRFSIVLPKTLLFISLKKSFQNHSWLWLRGLYSSLHPRRLIELNS